MKAIVLDRHGPPDESRVRIVPVPQPSRRQLLVRLVAAGVNPVDVQNRADGSWARIPLPAILGSDAAGVVNLVGDDTRDLVVGDEVFYFSDFLGNSAGSYAEFQVVEADRVVRKPSSLSFVEAAAVPLAAGTAWEVVVRRLAIGARQSVVVYGAAGGVGSYAVQLAAHADAEVIAVASRRHHPLLRQLGAGRTYDYTDVDVEAAIAAEVGEVDAVADFVGGETISSSLRILRSGGKAATVCGLNGDLDLAIDKNITLYGVLVRPDRRRLEALAALLDDGKLRPIVRCELPLDQAAEAHRLVQSGHGQGKVVLRIHAEPG
jgi:NADPH2:quinone reductase